MNTTLAFLLTLAILIAVHEYGHYRVARWCGVRVLRFSLGFGPVLWRGHLAGNVTEFTLSAIPLGGYVKMLDTREGPVPAEDQALAFDRQSLRARAAIVLAGPLANLLLAVLLFAAAGWWGMEEPLPIVAAPAVQSLAAQAGLRAGDKVLAVSEGQGVWQDLSSLTELRAQVTQAVLDGRALQLMVVDAQGSHRRTLLLPLDRLAGQELDGALLARIGIGMPFSEPVLGEIKVGGPAAQASLLAGDRVLSVDGVAVEDAQSLRERIRAYVVAPGAEAQQWLIERSGQRQTREVTPRRATDANGQEVGRIDAFVGLPPATAMMRTGLWEGLSMGVARTIDTASLSLRMIGRMLTGEASLKNLSGPLTIAAEAGSSVERGMAYYLGFLAFVSVSLGVLNLLPLPILDGGHLLYYLYEGLTGRPVSDLWLAWLQRGGAIVLLLMMSIALSNDVARLLGLQ